MGPKRANDAAEPTMAVQTRLIHGIEDLQQPVKGADVAINQVEAGQLTGSVTYGMLGTFSVSLGHFSKAVRSKGVLSRERQVIGMLLDRDDAVTHYSLDMQPGDIIFDHLGASHDGIYKGGAKFATIALNPAELAELMAGEAAMADLAFWQRRTHVRPDPVLGTEIPKRFSAIIRGLDEHAGRLSPAGSQFWMRALVETFAGALTGGFPRDGNRDPVKSALIIRKVDDFLEERGAVPVHVSELCRALQVSRRTLHRAFDETLGIGPITYLRRQRLNAVRNAFIRGEGQHYSIAEIAMNHGFDEIGRFAGYYRRFFGELPSHTARRFSSNQR